MKMKTMNRKTLRAGALLLLIAALFGPAFFQTGSAQAATLPAESCLLDTGTNTRTCDLWATTGVISLPGWPAVPIWGYSLVDPALGGAATLPGPALIANEGETLVVNLHNSLTETTGLSFEGQAVLPDLAGIAAGGMKTYTIDNLSAGTFLYEAAPLPNAQHQVAMGMVGALIVRPAGLPGQAYASPATAFQDEALLVISELDPSLNFAVDPAAFDMRTYQPLLYLINGAVHPVIPEIASTAGNALLLRYINAGLQPHTLSLLGMDQRLIAKDGFPYTYTRRSVAANIAPGETQDALVVVPPGAAGKFALYDSNLILHTSSTTGYGGMLTFINLGTVTPPSAGPVTTSVSLSPNPTGGAVDVTLTAVIPGATGAEFFIGAQGVGGTGVAMSAAGGDSWSALITAAELSLLASGDHTFYVHGTDGVNWGAFNFAVLHLDKTGPMVSGVLSSPNPSNGSLAVSIAATADDSMSGNSNVTAAMYMIDDMMAPGEMMMVDPLAPVASLSAVIPAATLQTLVEGQHSLHVLAQDVFGNWGMHGTGALDIDKTGPDTTSVIATPDLLYARVVVRVDASLSDPLVTADVNLPGAASLIKKVEGFIDTVGADGSGFPLIPRDGLFDEQTESAYANIPLATVNSLSEGLHTIYVHGQDSSGNWGAVSSATFTILPQLIFSDGFEAGDFSAWSASTGIVSVSAAAARTGLFGMQASLAGAAFGYVTDDTPMLEPSYKARFYFNPNGALPVNNNTNGVTIFAGLDGVNATAFQAQFRRQNQGGGTYQVRLSVARAGGVSNSAWYTISNAWHSIEISWASNTAATVNLYVDGVLRQSLAGLNTNAYKIASVRLGPSAGALGNSASGVMYFDDFVSRRTQYIGP